MIPGFHDTDDLEFTRTWSLIVSRRNDLAGPTNVETFEFQDSPRLSSIEIQAVECNGTLIKPSVEGCRSLERSTRLRRSLSVNQRETTFRNRPNCFCETKLADWETLRDTVLSKIIFRGSEWNEVKVDAAWTKQSRGWWHCSGERPAAEDRITSSVHSRNEIDSKTVRSAWL